jgi:septum formation protein
MTKPLPRIILASTSPYRRDLLKKLGLPFECATPGIDESRRRNESAQTLASRLAQEKAVAIANQWGEGLIIGSDQVAALDGILIGKPGSREAAIDQLLHSSGRTVEFHTAVCVTQAETGISRGLLDLCRVTFRPLTEDQIKRYLDADQPYDCAGSFKSEGLGISLMERIEGNDPNALVGLPVINLIRLLDSFGVQIP